MKKKFKSIPNFSQFWFEIEKRKQKIFEIRFVFESKKELYFRYTDRKVFIFS